MNVLVILAHPDKNSFNHAIFEKTINRLKKNGHNIYSHNLCAEGFNPLIIPEEIPKSGRIDKIIKQHCEELSQADGIIIIHPNWWGQPPAILKGWIDRVLRPGIAYEFIGDDSGEGIPVGLLKARSALVFNTSNTEKIREEIVFKDPLEAIWKNCIFDLCGVKYFYRKMFRIVITSTPQERESWLNEVDSAVNSYYPQQVK
jgi:NAD(P)H dehydrogenase (quinone)